MALNVFQSGLALCIFISLCFSSLVESSSSFRESDDILQVVNFGLDLGLGLAQSIPRSKKPKDECPPCFNCMLPSFSCKQFGHCNEYTGRCDCPEGFGGEDCSSPVCGNLGKGSNRPLRNGTECQCSEGWEGINCNMCTDDKSCNAFMPGGEPGTCYKGGLLVNSNYQMCDVTNRKILDILNGKIPQVTFTCNKTAGACDFQFWVDQKESFFCGLNGCDFKAGPVSGHKGNVTQYHCEDIQCACIPDRMLCGESGSIDISDFLTETIKGPGDFECDLVTNNCFFSEPSMNDLIKSVFGDSSITLDCLSSECLHYTEVPGYQAPINETNRGFVIAALTSSLVFIFACVAAFQYFVRKNQRDANVGNIHLPSDTGDASKVMSAHKPASLFFSNISYTSGKGAAILQDVFGSCKAGETMAILGGSGAGKTTLLDILAKKQKTGKVSGNIYVNGKEMLDVAKYRLLTGFVDQEDLMMPTLTVYETILTSALLRLPRSVSDDAKKLRVLETMNELGILGLKDRLIGDETNRGISGGEKRRVAIACELVTSPSILFLDEPTSGLDAYNAYNVVESLVLLARKYNRTVVFTIHQPRSNIVALFDKLLLLAQGRLIYSGDLSDAASFFSEVGYECPPGYNVADYLVDMTMQASASNTPAEGDNLTTDITSSLIDIQNQVEEDEEDLHRIPRTNTQEYDSTREWRHLQSHQQELGVDAKHRKKSVRSLGIPGSSRQDAVQLITLIDLYKNSPKAEEELRKITDAVHEYSSDAGSSTSANSDAAQEEESKAYLKKAGLFKQFRVLSDRTFKNFYRSPMLLFTHYVIAALLAVFCGVLYYNVANDISGFQNRLGLFFFLLTLFGFSTLTTLQLFADERVIFVRERSNDYYHPIAYYASKVMFDIIPLRVLPPVLLALIVYPLVGLSTEQGAFGVFTLVLVLFNLTAASIFLVIGIVVRNSGVASLVGCLVMLFSLLFAGLFLNQDSMPTGTIWFKYLSIFHYAYEALVVNEVRYLTLTEKKFGLSIEVPGATILSTFGFDSAALWADVIGLSIFFGVFLVAGYIAMHFILVERR